MNPTDIAHDYATDVKTGFIEPPLYKSLLLEKEVKMWVNLYKIKARDFQERGPGFTNKLKAFTEKLRDRNTPVKKFDFNKTSVYYYLEEIFT